MVVCAFRGLTFDMSGGAKGAKQPLERPLDGGVRAHGAVSKLNGCLTMTLEGFPSRVAGAIAHRETAAMTHSARDCLLDSRMRTLSTAPDSAKLISTTTRPVTPALMSSVGMTG